MIIKIIKNVVLILLLLLTFTICLTWATLAVENIPNNTTSGTVIKKEDKIITVQTDDGVKDYNIPDGIKITKNQFETDLNNISPNDRITITTGNNGNILSLDAVSNSIANWKTTILPLAALILIIFGLILTLWQKRQQGIIKTKTINYKN